MKMILNGSSMHLNNKNKTKKKLANPKVANLLSVPFYTISFAIIAYTPFYRFVVTHLYHYDNFVCDFCTQSLSEQFVLRLFYVPLSIISL